MIRTKHNIIKMCMYLDVEVFCVEVVGARHLFVFGIHEFLNALHLDILRRQKQAQVINEPGLMAVQEQRRLS